MVAENKRLKRNTIVFGSGSPLEVINFHYNYRTHSTFDPHAFHKGVQTRNTYKLLSLIGIKLTFYTHVVHSGAQTHNTHKLL